MKLNNEGRELKIKGIAIIKMMIKFNKKKTKKKTNA